VGEIVLRTGCFDRDVSKALEITGTQVTNVHLKLRTFGRGASKSGLTGPLSYSFDEGPGDDDLEGGIFAVPVTGRAIFVGFFKRGIFDESMIGEEEERGSGR
jgi:hypothetical protein